MIFCNWYSWHIAVGNVGGNIIKRVDKMAVKLSIICIDDKGFYTVKLQAFRPPPLKSVCQAYPTMMKLCIVIPYLKKIQKIYEAHATPLEFC